MTTKKLKAALLEIKQICADTVCGRCPFALKDEAGVAYCPMHETEEGETVEQPCYWGIDEWEDDE